MAKKQEVEEEIVEVKEKKEDKKISFTLADWDEYMRSGNTTGIVKSFPDFLKERE